MSRSARQQGKCQFGRGERRPAVRGFALEVVAGQTVERLDEWMGHLVGAAA